MKASFDGGVWMSSPTSTSTEVYFSADKATAFHLKKFDTEEEPNIILKLLKENGHPNFAQVYPVFQVEGQKDFFLAFKKHGVSLEDFLKNDGNIRSLIFHNHLITEFYQKILIDLLRVWRHLVKLQLKCHLKLDNVYIFGKISPTVSLVDFSIGEVYCNQWLELAELIENINNKCRYNSDYVEMRSFLDGIKSEDKGFMESLPVNPLFFTRLQRRILVCDLFDYASSSWTGLYSNQLIFTNNPGNWKRVGGSTDPRLKAVIEITETAQQDHPSWGKPDDFSVKACLRMIRQVYADFYSMSKQVTGKMKAEGTLQPGQSAFKTIDDFQILVEDAYPNHVSALCAKAVQMQKAKFFKMVPENRLLKEIWNEKS